MIALFRLARTLQRIVRKVNHLEDFNDINRGEVNANRR
jgi:hypothetical protein|tara:strand:- start:337 stop:450 length:114 start_codon:yes stop_codon:yes gene_type:complete